jgi:aconitate hydratase
MEKSDLEMVEQHFQTLTGRIAEARKKLNRPLTLTEKILFTHISAWPDEEPVRGKTHLNLLPDRVAMQDATAQMAILQFMVTARDTVAVPTTVHCDHLIQAKVGSEKDLLRAFDENKEVYDFLSSSSQKFGIGFWKAGAGIIHQVVLEQYAFPGGMVIGTDSHTPNAGGLGMVAIGVGGADAVDVMAGQPWSLLNPKIIGIKLMGRLNGWASAKDVILKVAGALTVKGGTGKIIEYFGPGVKNISCTGKATIANMGAELGATTSVFPFDEKMAEYLRQTDRGMVAELASKNALHLGPDPEIEADPSKYYDEILEIDLSELEPQWVGPHTPDLLRKVSEMKNAVKENGYSDEIRYALIGSCTNSSYEDISRSANLAKQAMDKGLKVKVPFLVTPGSDQIFKTIERDGFLKIFEDVGATVLANACGPCIGQWSRSDIKQGEKNTIVTSYNRNFRKRNDGNNETAAFIGSPELVTAMSFYGNLSANPLTDSIKDSSGAEFKFAEPSGDELPKQGFVFSKEGYLAPLGNLEERKKREVVISPTSDRLSFLEVFPPWNGNDFVELNLLLKAQGKCTTDHISQAGPWLKYRGHLANISNNTYLGAVNAFTGEAGKGLNQVTGEKGISFPEIGKFYKSKGLSWAVVADENYGEGSSREHAAMSPRFLGCKVVIAKSFARIAETNLKKQGILPLTFTDPAFYDQITEDSKITVLGVKQIKPGSELTMKIKNAGGEKETKLKHSMNNDQIEWFKAGSALNMLRPK